jgi:hypothetical protein
VSVDEVTAVAVARSGFRGSRVPGTDAGALRGATGHAPDQAERAFDEMADKIIAYLSSPIPSAPDPPYRVGPCTACGKDDCWVSPRSGRQS